MSIMNRKARVAYSTAQRCRDILRYVREQNPDVVLSGSDYAGRSRTLCEAFSFLETELEGIMTDSMWNASSEQDDE